MSSKSKAGKPGVPRLEGWAPRSPKSGRFVDTPSGKLSSKGGGEVAITGKDGRIRSVMQTAKSVGLLKDKDSRITGRVSADLVKEAKAATGIQSDTALVEFALANVAIEDGFAEAFRATKATVPRDIDLDF